MKATSLLLLSLSALPFWGHAAEDPIPDKIEYNRDVRPIFSENCFKCHGFDSKQRKGDLRLDRSDDAYAEHKGVRALIPGNLKDSSVHDRIHTTDDDDLMPPRKSGKHLTERQKTILDKWIEQGAAYQPLWSYMKLTRPQAPATPAGMTPGANAIDAFVRARLGKLGWTPAPKADRATLCRRLYLDLLGLPPKPSEVAAFVNDPSPDAYGKLVDELLRSEHYGERMAAPWLDVVRFADTIGFHSDNPRNIWPYRDYVIHAFNQNLPFDQFTREQIAGDLLPDATMWQKVASAFNRLNLSTEEGGAQAKDYEARTVADRVRAIGTVWLGQTFGCCQCHDHKFDPITMRDFYGMGAFFADIKESAIGRREDGMLVTTPAEAAEMKRLDDALAAAQKELDPLLPRLKEMQAKWETDVVSGGVILTELTQDTKATPAEKQRAQKVLATLKKEPKTRRAQDTELITTYFRDRVNGDDKPLLAKVQAAKAARDAYYTPLTKCLVSVSMKPTRVVHVLPRGNWMDESGEVMQPKLPDYLNPPKADHPLTRLDLANWLVSADNPLTARVIMNRLWKQYFGIGLSKVLDDLGAQGETPVQQELLDWLACEFRDSGWDMKHMVRLIVGSSTYRQSSSTTKEIQTQDPLNRELARQSRFRLDAELVRDNALAISGLLVDRVGGPSVKPYQPEGYWDNLNFPARKWQADTNENEWRRGLYTWWQRSYLQPSMVAFDAPSREECCAERVRSNIPQQALVLLNDPTYVEASRAFAARILQECHDTNEARIQWAWRQATARTPNAQELQTVRELLEKHLIYYQAHTTEANELIKVGLRPAPADLPVPELAAWTSVARTLLNLHETVTRL